MSWTGEFRSRGHYKLTVHGGVWELHYRRASPAEPEGWYLYGDTDSGVVGEFMAKLLRPAQRSAERFVTVRGADQSRDRAMSAGHDETWTRLLQGA